VGTALLILFLVVASTVVLGFWVWLTAAAVAALRERIYSWQESRPFDSQGKWWA